MEKVTDKVNLKRMELVLAQEPKADLMKRISKKVGELFPHTLEQGGVSLDIKVDKSILGGAVIYFDGRYFNGSLKKKIDDFFDNRK